MVQLDDVIANKQKIITSEDIYNKIYASQFIELTKNMLSFLLAHLTFRLLQISVLDTIANDRIVSIVFLILLILFVLYMAVELFTYLKIKNDKEKYLDELTVVKTV